MTREEAIVELELAARFCVNISALSMAQNIANAIAVLREPQIDENGLVPCGCGGVAISEDYFGDDDVESSYRAFVSCEKCELRTSDYPRLFDAKEAWNTAMGRKGGAE